MDATTTVDYHRNGVSGEGFYIVHFDDPEGEYGRMMAIVFLPESAHDEDGYMIMPSQDHNPRVAVFAEDKLPDTRFGHNSYRGDNYATFCYEAILAHENASR